MEVNLADLGWDFVVFPSVIQYTFCQGHCDPAILPARFFIPQIAQIRYVSYKMKTISKLTNLLAIEAAQTRNLLAT